MTETVTQVLSPVNTADATIRATVLSMGEKTVAERNAERIRELASILREENPSWPWNRIAAELGLDSATLNHIRKSRRGAGHDTTDRIVRSRRVDPSLFSDDRLRPGGVAAYIVRREKVGGSERDPHALPESLMRWAESRAMVGQLVDRETLRTMAALVSQYGSEIHPDCAYQWDHAYAIVRSTRESNAQARSPNPSGGAPSATPPPAKAGGGKRGR